MKLKYPATAWKRFWESVPYGVPRRIARAAFRKGVPAKLLRDPTDASDCTQREAR
jgi:hypothetical protein